MKLRIKNPFKKNTITNNVNYNPETDIKIYLLSLGEDFVLNNREEIHWFSRHTNCLGFHMEKTHKAIDLVYDNIDDRNKAYCIAKERYFERTSIIKVVNSFINKERFNAKTKP